MAATKPGGIQPPTSQDIYRYRYHHGANLGSIYVLEKWLFPSAFPDTASAAQTSELEACRLWTAKEGIEATRLRFERRWADALTDADIEWLAVEGRCTSIRLPIGYFTLGAAYIPASSPFSPFASIYAHAWDAVKTLIGRLHEYGIGVLVDLHALPGGANAEEHSGTNLGTTQLWNDPTNLAAAKQCLIFLATQIHDLGAAFDNAIGIQLCNEAVADAPGMYDFYSSVQTAIAVIDPSIPLYVSDGWDLGRCLAWSKDANKIALGQPFSVESNRNATVIDTHLYWSFSNNDKKKSPTEIIEHSVPTSLSALTHPTNTTGESLGSGAAQVIVGEYSLVLDDATWRNSISPPAQSRELLTRSFGRAQASIHQSTAGCGGSYFWTYKMDWMPGGDWGFKNAVKGTGSVTPNLSLHTSGVKDALYRAEFQQNAAMTDANRQHCGFWDQHCPGESFEHWRFENGWKIGFGDAAVFFSARIDGVLGGKAQRNDARFGVGGDKIGCLEIWVRKRIVESGMTGDFVWEFEQGLRRGVLDFYVCAGI